MLGKRMLYGLVFVVMGAMLAGSALAQLPMLSTFAVTAEGWEAVGGDLHYQLDGGNPGGFIEFEDLEIGSGSFSVPASFLGDLSTYDGGALKFELKNTADNGNTMEAVFGMVAIESHPVGIELNVTSAVFLADWTTISVPLTAEAWELVQEDWESVLANVTSILIYVDAQSGLNERVGLDNFRITPSGVVPAAQQSWGDLKGNFAR